MHCSKRWCYLPVKPQLMPMSESAEVRPGKLKTELDRKGSARFSRARMTTMRQTAVI